MSDKPMFTRDKLTAEKPRWYAPTDEAHIYDMHGQLIARIPSAGRFQSVNEAIANAHLMSAAPDLYEALDSYPGPRATPDEMTAWLAKAKAAVNKALGKS